MAEKIPGLAEKLDDDLNKFISQLKPRQPGQDAWPEDKWEEEMEKHPFFMTKAVEEGQELPPLVEAIQQLKFDPEQNTPEELAIAYKEEGNEYFKLKKYKWAVISYTEGIKVNSNDQDVNSILYANRAASHFRLGNIQKALKDCVEAVNLKANHIKAIHRAAECYLKLKDFDNCLLWCEKGLSIEKEDLKLRESFQKLAKDANSNKKILDRDKRKSIAKATQKGKEWNYVRSTIENRGINFKEDESSGVPGWWPSDQSFGDSRVHLDGDCLIWPVLILYPEYNVTDFIQCFNENYCFIDHLRDMFSQDNIPSWDKDRKYRLDNMNVYFANENVIHPVNIEESLKNILVGKDFVVYGGVPTFFITAKNSSFDDYWISKGLTIN